MTATMALPKEKENYLPQEQLPIALCLLLAILNVVLLTIDPTLKPLFCTHRALFQKSEDGTISNSIIIPINKPVKCNILPLLLNTLRLVQFIGMQDLRVPEDSTIHGSMFIRIPGKDLQTAKLKSNLVKSNAPKR
jgi:hypothetical protein